MLVVDVSNLILHPTMKVLKTIITIIYHLVVEYCPVKAQKKLKNLYGYNEAQVVTWANIKNE